MPAKKTVKIFKKTNMSKKIFFIGLKCIKNVYYYLCDFLYESIIFLTMRPPIAPACLAVKLPL